MTKIGLPSGATVYRRHVADLTGPQLKAIAFIHMRKKLTGSVKDIRKAMEELLPVDPDYDAEAVALGVPEYPTQDEVLSDPDSSSEETTSSDLIDFDNLFIGDIVEVYWPRGTKAMSLTWMRWIVCLKSTTSPILKNYDMLQMITLYAPHLRKPFIYLIDDE